MKKIIFCVILIFASNIWSMWLNWSHLHHAVQENHLGKVQFLLDNGACIDAQNRYNETPLHEACKHGFFCIAKLLMERGADITIKNIFNDTPFEAALVCGTLTLEQVKYFVKNRATFSNYAIEQAKDPSIKKYLNGIKNYRKWKKGCIPKFQLG